MKFNLRDILFHLKSKDYIKYNGQEKYDEKDKECKEIIHESVKENIDFFAHHPKLYQNQDIHFELSINNFRCRGMTLDEAKEIQEKFNRSATGLFGRHFDNSANMLLADTYGRLFVFYINKKKDAFEVNLWDTTGTKHLVNIQTKSNTLTKEEIDKLDNAWNILLNKIKEQEESRKRYEEIKSHREFIKVERTGGNYARANYKVTIDKKIPIELTKYEIAKYCDGWNYCFGGGCSLLKETNDETIYSVTVYTD